jgi:copper(I)-binding protein
MQLRRALLCALVLALGALTSCGFDLATDQPFTPGEGANASAGLVDVLAAVVVAAQPNEGTVVLTLVNKSSEDDAALTGISAPDLEVEEFEPVEVGPREMVNLADDGGILVSGDFDAGQLLPLTMTFANGDTVALNVPIVTACNEFLGLDLTEASEFVPYDCDFEPPPPSVVGEEVDPAGGVAEDSE